jgi:hypothetical protein
MWTSTIFSLTNSQVRERDGSMELEALESTPSKDEMIKDN